MSSATDTIDISSHLEALSLTVQRFGSHRAAARIKWESEMFLAYCDCYQVTSVPLSLHKEMLLRDAPNLGPLPGEGAKAVVAMKELRTLMKTAKAHIQRSTGDPFIDGRISMLSKVFVRPDGSEVKIVANDDLVFGSKHVDVFRRGSGEQPWILCSPHPHPNSRNMSREQYLNEGRPEKLQYATHGEILKMGYMLSLLNEPLPPCRDDQREEDAPRMRG